MRFVPSSVCIALLSAAAQAQSPDERPREGAYIDVSAAYAGVGLSTSGCAGADCISSQSTGGLAWSVALGMTLNAHWRLGLQLDTRPATFGAGVTEEADFYTFAGTWYPMEDKSFWIRGNLGLGTVKLTMSSPPPASATTAAFGGGIGFDFFPSRWQFAIVPFASYLAQVTSADLGGAHGRAQMRMLQAGVAFGLRH